MRCQKNSSNNSQKYTPQYTMWIFCLEFNTKNSNFQLDAQRTLTTIFRVKFGDVQLEKPAMHNSNRVKITSKNVVLRSAPCERESLRVSAFKRTRWCVSLSSGCCLSTIQLDMCEYLVYECVWVSLCLSGCVCACALCTSMMCVLHKVWFAMLLPHFR